MPHQCTNCARVFDDGSKEMLSGCPDCGGTKFQFHPTESDVPSEPTADPPDPPESPGTESSVAQTVGSAATAVRDLVGGDPGPQPADDGHAAPAADATSEEDAAQASARSDVVGPDELPPAPERSYAPTTDPPSVASAASAEPEAEQATEADPDPERPDLSELREELNDQFESIKVLEPGQYELNLMELYDRDEYIIALQEDGRYSIQVPDAIDS
jgi:predicted  nucleic acid-binding Zn-ribbon protein